MKKYLAAICAFLFAVPAARADWFADYVRYSNSAELGQIVIESGRVRGKHNVLRAHKSVQSLAAKNIFVGAGNKDQSYRRTSFIGKHKVESVITVHPPTGHGYGGANYTFELETRIDGKEKIHCNLGYLAQADNLHVEKLVIYPEDEFIEVSATAGGTNRNVDPPVKHCIFSDPHIISNESLIYAR